MSNDLKDCPFCKMTPPEDLSDTLYPSGSYWREEEVGYRHYFDRDEAKPGDGRCWTMHCTENMGGCGAQISGDSEQDARDRWNRRPELAGYESNGAGKLTDAEILSIASVHQIDCLIDYDAPDEDRILAFARELLATTRDGVDKKEG